jgi:hypothetical protein
MAPRYSIVFLLKRERVGDTPFLLPPICICIHICFCTLQLSQTYIFVQYIHYTVYCISCILFVASSSCFTIFLGFLRLIDSIPSSYPKSFHLCGHKMLLIPRYVTTVFWVAHSATDIYVTSQTVCIRLRC